MPVERYSGAQIALHWAIAFLVVLNWFVSDGMHRLFDKSLNGEEVGTPLHVWVGVLILILVAIRLYVRLTSPVPGAPPGTSGIAARARHWGHILLYVLIIMVPLGGALTWFLGLRTGVHHLAANALMIVASGHVVMALYHQGVKQDGTLTRMLKSRDG